MLYRIWWQQAQIDYGSKGAFGGQMTTVRGELYEDGAVSSTFTADRGFADRETHLLRLSGHVRIRSLDPKAKPGAAPLAVLTCDTVEWYRDPKLESQKGVVKAKGAVRVEFSEGGVLGPMDAVWSTGKLDRIGTPEAFSKQ